MDNRAIEELDDERSHKKHKQYNLKTFNKKKKVIMMK